jgi:tungstate transport system permease protein
MPGILDNETFGIIKTTLLMAFCSTTISSAAGTFLGLLLERARFPGKSAVVRVNRTLMGVPPVVMGLVVYLLFMRKGPFGALDLLFTVPAMVVAQVLIITPIICGMVYTAASSEAGRIRAFGVTMGASPAQMQLLLVLELSHDIYFAVVAGFGRSISEVGAILIVGGNIRNRTRTMTTAITMLRNSGDYGRAIFLGIILLFAAFLIHTAADGLRGQREQQLDENY